MPIYADFPLSKYTDGILTIKLTPAAAVGLWDLRFRVCKRAGGESGLINKYYASGFAGSGITLQNSGQGIINIRLDSADTSGLPLGNYYASVTRWSSGSVTTLTEGFIVLTPGG